MTLTLRSLLPLLLLTAACSSLPFPGRDSRQEWGFTAPWDTRSAESVALHGESLDVVVSGWLALDPESALPAILFPDTASRGLSSTTRRYALVTSFVGDRFRPEVVRRLANDPARLALAASGIVGHAALAGYEGLVIDFEGMAASDLGALVVVIRAIRDSARARGVGPVAVAVPAGDTAAYPGRLLLEGADLILVMLYDEHWSESPAGPISSPDWVRRHLGLRVAEVGASRIVASLPLYGYRWMPGAGADVLGFDDARRIVADAGRELIREPASHTLRASLPDGSEIWVTDYELLERLIGEVSRAGVRRVAFWRLGQEDRRMWKSSY